jgi:transcriptional regulator with XRE-family HTH domain
MDIGDRIALARGLVGLSQTDLAAMLGVSRGLVGQWESHRKKPGRENVSKIAQATLVGVGWLMGEDDAAMDRLTIRPDADQLAMLRYFARLRPIPRENFLEGIARTADMPDKIEAESEPVEGQIMV